MDIAGGLRALTTVLGVRCWKHQVAIVAISDDAGAGATVVLHRRSKLPAGLGDGERADWVYKAVVEAIEESKAAAVAVRVSDADPDQHRAEHDGAALLAAAHRKLQATTLRRQSMLKPLGVPSGRGEWAQFPKQDPFISGFVGEEREAAMAARTVLNLGTAS